MAPRPDPVVSDETLPERAVVVVIGGGIIGACTALELAERGIDVVVCEKGEVGAEQSSRNWGWCRQMGRDPREIPLAIEALRLWRGMNERVSAETGFRQCGIAYLSQTDEEVASRERWLEHARPYQVDSRLLSGAKAGDLVPGASIAWRGALYTPSDGRAEPQKAAPAIANAARAHGARIFPRCAVRGIETTAGKVSGVVTEKGTIACDSVVLAGGAWSRRFCGNLGVYLPQLSVVNSVQRTAPLAGGPEVAAAGDKFAFRKRLDGGYSISHRHLSVADIVPDTFALFFTFLPALRVDRQGLRLRLGRRFIDEARLARRWALDQISPFEQMRVLDPEPVAAILEEALDSLRRTYPVFAAAEVAERWAGCIDVTPDAVPVISHVDSLPGLTLATGFSGHGFGIGPGAGRLVADLVTGAAPVVDPSPFRYSRFVDGSKLVPMAG
ncbi:MAG TPA: FAD-binding oxidoreductase [Aestuariivirgaceae bacterium]|nr:FAD-binding oxidoreductase [Aestuariivirgaceae bacterium]